MRAEREVLPRRNARRGAWHRAGSRLSTSDEYRTPDWLFRARDARFRFELDVAAARWNAQCSRFFTKADNALVQLWPGRCWLNPPYSRGHLLAFIGEAREQVRQGPAELVDCLVPSATSERWFQEQVMAPAGDLLGLRYQEGELGVTTAYLWTELVVEVLFLRRRVSFVEKDAGQLPNGRASHALVTFIKPSSEHVQTFGPTRR
jgi:hypothetical protein